MPPIPEVEQMSSPRLQPRAKAIKKQSHEHAEELKKSLPERFFLRFHMTIILLGVAATGLITSKLLLAIGFESLLTRYLLAVTIAYGSFFLFMRTWLWYIQDSDDSSSPDIDVLDAVDFGGEVLITNAGAPAGDSGFSGFGGAGDFAGAGASDSWGDAPDNPVAFAAAPIKPPAASDITSSKAGSGGSLFDIDFDEGGIVLVVLGLLLLVVFGAGAYLIYQAPVILSEAVFQAVLASSLVKASKRIDTFGFMGSVLRATYIPFLIVLAMTIVFGLVAARYCPEATKLADLFKACS
jgi:hypothetical protein